MARHPRPGASSLPAIRPGGSWAPPAQPAPAPAPPPAQVGVASRGDKSPTKNRDLMGFNGIQWLIMVINNS